MTPAEAGLSTDHDLLKFDVIVRHHRITKTVHSVYNFKAADLDSLKSEIQGSASINDCVSGTDIDVCWLKWKEKLLSIIDSHVPKVRIKDANTPPWIDKDVIHLLKKKETARRAAKKHNSEFYLKKFRLLRKESKELINNNLKEYIDTIWGFLERKPQALLELLPT
jgi:hypothetical protein